MTQASDIFGPANMSYGFNGNLLNGINAGDMRDAHFFLPLNGAIDGNRFHRLTFNVFYEGPFSLGFEPGGGMVARLIWETAGAPGVWQDSDDIVVYPGWNNISIDMATSPAYAITDPDTPNRIGWAGQQITAVRFDPHEDIGARRFLVDNIKLAEDSTGYGGAYDVRFHDNAWQRGHARRRLRQPDPRSVRWHAHRVEHRGRAGRQHVPLEAGLVAAGQPVGSTCSSSAARTRRARSRPARCG